MTKRIWVLVAASCLAMACKSSHESSKTEVKIEKVQPPAAVVADDPPARCAKNDQDACAELSNDPAQITKLCDSGSLAACNTLGAVKFQGSDKDAGIALWTKTCAAKNAVGCFNLGVAAHEGLAGDKDLAKALGFFEQACDAGKANACSNAGQMLGDGEGVAKDIPAAAKLLAKGCSGGEDEACRMLGNAAQLLANDPKTQALAEPYWQQLCDAYNGAGCFEVKQYERACQLHDKRGCQAAVEPLLAAKDTAKALPLLQEACRLDDQHACKTGCELGDPLTCEYAGNKKRALELRVKGCDANDAKSCFDLGYAYHHGEGVKLDHAKAAGLEQKACTLGALDACFDIAERKDKAIDQPEDVAGAVADYQDLCKRGYGSACYAIAYCHKEGRGVAKDEALATKLFSEGCNKVNDASSCFEAAHLTMSADKPTAVAMLRKGCRLGESRQCEELAGMGIHERPDPSHSMVFNSSK